MPPTVRPAGPGDLGFLVQASLAVALESEGERLDEAAVRAAVARALADPGCGTFWVLDDGGRPVASTLVTREWSDWHAAWYWWIQTAYVVASRRGQGLWRRLYEGVREEARRRGDVRSVRLYVDEGNAAGLRAYRGLGMRQTGYLVFDHPL